MKDKSVLKEQAQFLCNKINKKEKMKGKNEVGPFRKQVEKAVKEKDNALYKEIFKIVGDTMQGKNDHDKL